MAQHCAGVMNCRLYIAHQFQKLKFRAWAFFPPQVLSVYYFFFFPTAYFSHWWHSWDPRRPLSLCSEWCIGKRCALPVSRGLPFAPRPSVSPATPQVEPQASLGISRFFTCSGMRFTSEASCLDPHILSVIFLDFAPFWGTPMWTTCLAFEFPWLLGYISQIMQSVAHKPILPFFPLYFVQALIHLRSVKLKWAAATGNWVFNTVIHLLLI